MMSRLALILLLAGAAGAQIQSLGLLREERGRLGQVSDSLMAVRVRLLARRDSLAARADTLWSLAPASRELVRTRLAFRLLAGRLRRVEGHLDSVAAVEDSLDAELRDAYDWEISRLHGLLNDEGWDEGLFRQLLVFQDEREALGNPVRATRYRIDADHELGVSDDDGPDELRQKIEYAQDRVGELQSEQREIDRRLRHLERDIMVMRKYWHLNEEILHLRRDIEAQMRRSPRPGEVAPRGQGEVVPSQAPVRRGAPGTPEAEGTPVAPVEAQLLIQGQRLRARQQELKEVEAVLQERIVVFHERLSRMLEGAE